jgi:hypothetical protein
MLRTQRLSLTPGFALAMQHSMLWVGSGRMPSNRKARNGVNFRALS